MDIIYQDIDWCIPTIKKMAKKNAGLSNIFKTIRKQERTCYIGDIPMFTCVVNTLSEMGISKNKKELTYALRKIEEYREWTKTEKIELVEELFNRFHATKKASLGPTNNEKGGGGV